MVLDPDSTPTESVCLWLLRHKSLSPALAREVRRAYCNAAPTTTRPTTRPGAPPKADTEAAIRDVFRRLSHRYHPDHPGGSDAAMRAVLDARDQIRKALNVA